MPFIRPIDVIKILWIGLLYFHLWALPLAKAQDNNIVPAVEFELFDEEGHIVQAQWDYQRQWVWMVVEDWMMTVLEVQVDFPAHWKNHLYTPDPWHWDSGGKLLLHITSPLSVYKFKLKLKNGEQWNYGLTVKVLEQGNGQIFIHEDCQVRGIHIEQLRPSPLPFALSLSCQERESDLVVDVLVSEDMTLLHHQQESSWHKRWVLSAESLQTLWQLPFTLKSSGIEQYSSYHVVVPPLNSFAKTARSERKIAQFKKAPSAINTRMSTASTFHFALGPLLRLDHQGPLAIKMVGQGNLWGKNSFWLGEITSEVVTTWGLREGRGAWGYQIGEAEKVWAALGWQKHFYLLSMGPQITLRHYGLWDVMGWSSLLFPMAKEHRAAAFQQQLQLQWWPPGQEQYALFSEFTGQRQTHQPWNYGWNLGVFFRLF